MVPFSRFERVPSQIAEVASRHCGTRICIADAKSRHQVEATTTWSQDSVNWKAFKVEEIDNSAPPPKDVGLSLRALDNYVSIRISSASTIIEVRAIGQSGVQVVQGHRPRNSERRTRSTSPSSGRSSSREIRPRQPLTIVHLRHYSREGGKSHR